MGDLEKSLNGCQKKLSQTENLLQNKVVSCLFKGILRWSSREVEQKSVQQLETALVSLQSQYAQAVEKGSVSFGWRSTKDCKTKLGPKRQKGLRLRWVWELCRA